MLTAAELHDARVLAGQKGGRIRALAFTSEYQKRARSFVSSESCALNGHKGFIATGGRIGWLRANRKAAAWRIAHPSEPERWIAAQLSKFGASGYVREFEPFQDDGRTIDFAWPDRKVGIEVNGHQNRPAFGESDPRIGRQRKKVAALKRRGWSVLVLDSTADRLNETSHLYFFLKDRGLI